MNVYQIVLIFSLFLNVALACIVIWQRDTIEEWKQAANEEFCGRE